MTSASENRLHPGAGLSCCAGWAFNPEEATCCKVEDGNSMVGNNHTFVSNSKENYILIFDFNPGKKVGELIFAVRKLNKRKNTT